MRLFHHKLLPDNLRKPANASIQAQSPASVQICQNQLNRTSKADSPCVQFGVKCVCGHLYLQDLAQSQTYTGLDFHVTHPEMSNTWAAESLTMKFAQTFLVSDLGHTATVCLYDI